VNWIMVLFVKSSIIKKYSIWGGSAAGDKMSSWNNRPKCSKNKF
jgi:hypothetical protein